MTVEWTICTSCNDAQVAVVWDSHPCSGLPYVVTVEGRCEATGTYHTITQTGRGQFGENG